jgi:hypothetical protein
MHFLCLCLSIGYYQDTPLGRQAKLFASIMSIDNKIDAFQSAAPPYQLSEELKVCPLIFSLMLSLDSSIDEHQQLCPGCPAFRQY